MLKPGNGNQRQAGVTHLLKQAKELRLVANLSAQDCCAVVVPLKLLGTKPSLPPGCQVALDPDLEPRGLVLEDGCCFAHEGTVRGDLTTGRHQMW